MNMNSKSDKKKHPIKSKYAQQFLNNSMVIESPFKDTKINQNAAKNKKRLNISTSSDYNQPSTASPDSVKNRKRSQLTGSVDTQIQRTEPNIHSTAKNHPLELNDPKFESTYSRFRTYQSDKKKKIDEMKKKIMEEEEKLLKKVPEINDRSKQLGSTEKGFLERLKENEENAKKKKKERLENYQKKKEEEERKILQPLLQKYQKVLGKQYIQEKIKAMMEWENKRVTKLKNLKATADDKKLKECKFKPEIDKNSSMIATTKMESLPNSQLVERLYKQDIIKRKRNKEMLEDIYSPPFAPMTNVYNTESPEKSSSKVLRNGIHREYDSEKKCGESSLI